MTTPLPRRPGLIIPSSNKIMEADFVRYAPPGVSVDTARMFLEDTTPEAESRMLDEFTLPAARDLGTARPTSWPSAAPAGNQGRGRVPEATVIPIVARNYIS